MTQDIRLLSGLFAFFSRHRWVLFACTLLVVAGAAFVSGQIELSENIASLLPDDRSEAAESFALLNRMPFSRKIVIQLTAGPGTETARLLAAGRELARNLQPPYFSRVITGPETGIGLDFFTWTLNALPNLITETDLSRIDAHLTPQGIHARLKTVKQRLLAPTGIMEEALLRSDPFDLAPFGFEKFTSMNPFQGVRIVQNQFLSQDEKKAIVLADTPIEGTDFKEGKRLIEHLEHLFTSHVPGDITVDFISVHRYTVANAEVMKADVWRVIGISTALLLLLFLIFLPHWRAGFVLLIPITSLVVASGAVSLFFSEVSAVTLGFGAVILGISVDFGLHVYFALSSGYQDPGHSLDRLFRPILFSALTTIFAFGVLLFSKLPGQRQLAVFAIMGLFYALGVSLVVLPHLIKPLAHKSGRSNQWLQAPAPVWGKGIIGVWLCALILGIFGIRYLQFNGDLGALNRVSGDVLKAEEEIQKTWGDFRSKAMILCKGSTLETVLTQNDRVFSLMEQEGYIKNPVSLAPVLPSKVRQEINRKRWQDYWKNGNGARRLVFLKTEAATLGFSPEAFKPFYDRLDREVEPITAETLSAKGFSPMLELLLNRDENGFSATTLVPDTPKVMAGFSRIRKILPETRLVSQGRFREIISGAIKGDFKSFLISASVGVFLIAGFFFRRAKRLLLASIPVVTGTVVMAGSMTGLGLTFNLSNIIASILVIGLSIDYGIFMVYRLDRGFRHQTEEAVLVSGLTTISGFAALAVARHPALSSIGLTVVLGIGAAIPSALWVIPVLYRIIIKEKHHAPA